MVLTQTAGQGKLTTENWNQLSDAIPGASGKIQQALKEAGAYTGNFRDAMADGQITAQAAMLTLGSAAPLAYLPFLLLVSVFTGALTGFVATLLFRAMRHARAK